VKAEGQRKWAMRVEFERPPAAPPQETKENSRQDDLMELLVVSALDALGIGLKDKGPDVVQGGPQAPDQAALQESALRVQVNHCVLKFVALADGNDGVPDLVKDLYTDMIAGEGKAAFEAYNAGGSDPEQVNKNYRGEACPEWDALPPNVREKWIAAAHQVRLKTRFVTYHHCAGMLNDLLRFPSPESPI